MTPTFKVQRSLLMRALVLHIEASTARLADRVRSAREAVRLLVPDEEKHDSMQLPLLLAAQVASRLREIYGFSISAQGVLSGGCEHLFSQCGIPDTTSVSVSQDVTWIQALTLNF